MSSLAGMIDGERKSTVKPSPDYFLLRTSEHSGIVFLQIMNIGVVIIIAVALGLVVLIVLPRVRGINRAEKTTVERRSGRDRRLRKLRVPLNRRRRPRRTQDAAKAFVDNLST